MPLKVNRTLRMLKKNFLQEILFLVFAVTLPFGPAVPNIVFGIIVISWIYGLIKGELRLNKGVLKPFLLFNGFVLVEMISLIWSQHLSMGLDKIVLHLYFPLFFLVVASIHNNSKKTLTRIIVGFGLSVLALTIFSVLSSLLKNGVKLEHLTQNGLSESLINFHFLGMSLYVALAIVLILEIYIGNKKNVSRLKKYALIFSILFLLIVLFFLGSRTTIVFTLLILFIQLYRLFFRQSKAKFFLATLFLIVLSGVLVVTNPILQTKVKEAVNYNNQYDITEYWGGRGFRELIWNCAAHLVKQEPILGVGIGDQQTQMELCYKKYRYKQLYFKNNIFNCHSLFFQTMVATGLVGLIALLVAFFYPMMVLLLQKEWLFFILATLILGTGITESHFNRNAIVSVYAFFAPIIYFTILKDENTSTS